MHSTFPNQLPKIREGIVTTSPTSEHHNQYIGNRLVSYGLRIRMTTTWHRGRGDTAGYFTKV